MGKLQDKKLFLLDMDGTIYLDENLFDGTVDFLRFVRDSGGRYLFLTNNSSRSVDKYIEKMRRLGIETSRCDYLTSVDALVAYLRTHGPERKFYGFGTAAFCDQLRESGFYVTDHLQEDIDCLLCGFDTELTFQKLEDACILLERGVDFLAANPDWVCPTWYGYVPDCGSVCKMLETATGRKPRFLGKPQPDMVYLALQRTGYCPQDAIVIGDRIYTDIACGIRAGIDAALVLSGESTLRDVENSEVKPTHIYQNIREIYKILAFGGNEDTE